MFSNPKGLEVGLIELRTTKFTLRWVTNIPYLAYSAAYRRSTHSAHRQQYCSQVRRINQLQNYSSILGKWRLKKAIGNEWPTGNNTSSVRNFEFFFFSKLSREAYKRNQVRGTHASRTVLFHSMFHLTNTARNLVPSSEEANF